MGSKKKRRQDAAICADLGAAVLRPYMIAVHER
jgi:hypothetical protein